LFVFVVLLLVSSLARFLSCSFLSQVGLFLSLVSLPRWPGAGRGRAQGRAQR
jgi:hypothetical protein